MAVQSGVYRGVSASERAAERRGRLLEATLEVWASAGPKVTMTAICAQAGLIERYFYESFADTDELLGAVYDRVAAALATTVEQAMTDAGDSVPDRTRAGIRAVLGFSSEDPRRGRVLFTDARANPVLAARRAVAQDVLRELVLTESGQVFPDSDPVATRVGAAMYTGAMAELAQDWLAGHLGDDLDAVVKHAFRLVMRSAPAEK